MSPSTSLEASATGKAAPKRPTIRSALIGGLLVLELSQACDETGLRVFAFDDVDTANGAPITATVTQPMANADERVLHILGMYWQPLPKTMGVEFLEPGPRRRKLRQTIEIGPADDALVGALKTGVVVPRTEAPKADLDRLHSVLSALSASYVQVGYAIDVATVHDNRIYIDGWIENGPTLGLFLMSSDHAVFVPASDIVFKRRMDVSALIEGRGDSVVTHNHGFCAAAHLPPDHHPQRINIYAMSSGACSVVGSFALDRAVAPAAILSRFWEAFAGRALPHPRFSTDFIAPLIDKPSSTGRTYSTIELKPASVKPRLSIIVPLYGEPFFVRSLLAMQQFLPSDYEWIFVCDDARIASTVSDLMRRRTSFMRARTLLVLNHDNYGYAPSNNIGVLNATAETLLFMNSDIWIRSAGAIETALAELAATRWSLLGFHLSFEDGTTQHAAMTFARNPEYGSLYLAEHPGKGLPSFVADTDAITPALAVTGALFMVRRSVYDETGGFNEVFIKGDFEDADLCLRLLNRGGRIGVVPSTECFHLERQSIRTINSITTRTVTTYCNCVTFNDLWGTFLDQVEAARLARKAA